METIKLRVRFLPGHYLDLFSICHSKDDVSFQHTRDGDNNKFEGGGGSHTVNTLRSWGPQKNVAGCRGERYPDGYQRTTDNIRGSRSEGMADSRHADAGGG